jgi:hypothetical protein
VDIPEDLLWYPQDCIWSSAGPSRSVIKNFLGGLSRNKEMESENAGAASSYGEIWVKSLQLIEMALQSSYQLKPLLGSSQEQ